MLEELIEDLKEEIKIKLQINATICTFVQVTGKANPRTVATVTGIMTR